MIFELEEKLNRQKEKGLMKIIKNQNKVGTEKILVFLEEVERKFAANAILR